MNPEIRQDILTPALATRFAATFDRDPPEHIAPQGIHWCLYTPETASTELGLDGHPAGGGGFLPKSHLPRRMWASGEVEFVNPIPVGSMMERRSTVLDAVEKSGGTGQLLFVTVAHEIFCADVLLIREKQTIVYREAAAPKPGQPEQILFAEPDRARGLGWPWRRDYAPSVPLLFRYSALTFNSHRIHYDLPYARHEEAYPGLVVHGPLMATLLLDLCDRKLGSNQLAHFSFRALSPAFANEPLLLAGKPEGERGPIDLAVLGADGRAVMKATATRI